jgi:hypothetical protein
VLARSYNHLLRVQKGNVGLDDVRSFVTRAQSGSVLVITVQCHPTGYDVDAPRRNIDSLAEEIGFDRIDPTLDDTSLVGWNAAGLFRRIILNEVAVALQNVNDVRSPAQKMHFEQILHFHYKDGAQMLTVGGVLFDAGQRGLFDLCGFEGLDFVRRGDEFFKIDIPKLTRKEIRSLDAQMPLTDETALLCGTIPERDARQHMKIYRYFPHFVAADLQH